MNGVNCQVRTMTTVAIGCSVLHETTGRPRLWNSQLIIPMLVSNIEYFQISDAAAGMIRNGVIINVRATARPRNCRSNNTANNSPNNTAYAMTKAGVIGFTKALAAEAAPAVRVNAVAPGVTGTPMITELIKGYNDPTEAPFVKQLAMKRVADPSEIAHGVLFLLSEDASFVTGSALAVDGGRCYH